MNKPLLLIDVDGPLNPYAAKPTRRPPGFQTHRLLSGAFTDPLGRPWVKGGIRVWLNPDHGRQLLELTDVVDLVWATAWNDLANKLIAPILGLPQLPTIECVWQRGDPLRIWKRPSVEEYVRHRPYAWLDDEFTPMDLTEAGMRDRMIAPTLYEPVSPRTGITDKHLGNVRRWAEGSRQ